MVIQWIIAMDTDTRKVSLVGMHAVSNVENGGKKNATLFLTLAKKRNIG